MDEQKEQNQIQGIKIVLIKLFIVKRKLKTHLN